MELGSPPFHRARIAARRVLVLLFTLVTTLGLTACPGDDDGPTGGAGAGITGTWALQGFEDDIIVRITSSMISVYLSGVDCYFLEVWEITDVTGDLYTIESEGVTEEIEINRVGDNLEIEGETWVPSSVNVSNLEICDSTGPELGECSTLPLVGLSTTVSGSLSTTDTSDPDGYYYDLYRLQPTSSTNVQIRMTSSTIDAFVVVFDSNWTLVGYNDDDPTVETTDSRLQVTLSAGCFILMATSFNAGETGAYSLITSTF